MLAIGAFAGLREAEIERLDWSEIDLAHMAMPAASCPVPGFPGIAAMLRLCASRPILPARVPQQKHGIEESV
jgi:hypothetical protein